MAFTAETRWLARQEQSILSWVAKRRVQAGWALRSKGTPEASAPMRCGSNLREQIRVMLLGPARLRFTSIVSVPLAGTIFQAHQLSIQC